MPNLTDPTTALDRLRALTDDVVRRLAHLEELQAEKEANRDRLGRMLRDFSQPAKNNRSVE